eukprot:CAMPEP_0115022136 /NCGR_PEP_ID=MMETSP0216-20121206/31336_1 /TAXON_ID=223996 /ORGANISM="Protocruzia adherens, Strain Boccale" /LENGTH=168 /DNA_ID=CAMNT_0002394693 /DNA_START=67 /DNA_END=573 /DNA_ORIENTATION=+
MTELLIPSAYKYVLALATAITFECFFTGVVVVGIARRKVFNRQFLLQFEAEHRKEVGGSVAERGYPDNGSGYYASKLSYSDWLLFGNAQRVHHNFLEMLVPAILFLLIGGLGYPTQAIINGCLMFVGRILYAYLYTTKGANSRRPGVVLFEIPMLYNLVLTVMTICSL